MTLFGDDFAPHPGGVHEGDPETSVAAAFNPENMIRWGTQRHALLLSFQGRPGLTPDQAGELAQVSGYNQRRRCSELIQDGFLEPTGNTSNGQRILKITPEGERALRTATGRPLGRDYNGEQMKEVT